VEKREYSALLGLMSGFCMAFFREDFEPLGEEGKQPGLPQFICQAL
jgi:hypothetical protein